VRLLALALPCLALAACQSESVLPLGAWTLDADGAAVQLPAHLEARLGPAEQRRRYLLRAAVDLPASLRGRALTLTIPFFPALAELRVNGELIAPVEPPAPGDYRSPVGAHRWQLRPELTAQPLTLGITVTRRWTRSDWIDTVPRLSAAPAGDAAYRWVRAINGDVTVGVLAMLILVTFTHLLIFLLDRRRAAHGWLALQVGSSAIYPLYVLGVTQVLGTADTAVMLLLLAVSLVAGIQFAGAEFQLPAAPRAWAGVMAAVAVVLLAVHGPWQTLPRLLPAFMLLIVASIGFMAWLFWRASRRPHDRVDAYTFLVAWSFIFVLSGTDLTGLLGQGQPLDGVLLAPLSFGLFHVLQSIALSRKHIESLARADRLNLELAARVELLEQRNREINVLNEELRRQIGERSRQLSETLASLSVAARAPQPLLPGDTVEDRYRVVRAIGQGGMGAVYEVERIADGRRFALKQVRDVATVPALARLAREAQIIAALHDPRLVSIVDMNVASTGAVYLVMELVVGGSLESERARFGDVPWALPLLAQVAGGLEVIHAHDVVHRDLKPANLLLSRSDGGATQVKIADFGIARVGALPGAAEPTMDGETPSLRSGSEANIPTPSLSGEEDTAFARPAAELTETGAIVGTPMYVAPELCDGAREATAASDMFSFGVIAHELLAGSRPFSSPLIFERLRGRDLQPLRSLASVASLDAALARLLDRCLADDPAERPTAREAAQALSPDAAPARAGLRQT
jgi:serine/threonine-protein kinase